MSTGMCHEPFDGDYARSFVEQVLGPTFHRWFRPRLIGAHKLSRQGPAILAPNHSGNAFPYDAIVFDGLLWKRDGLTDAAKVRSLFEKDLAATWWMSPFGIRNFWRRAGGVDATYDNAGRLLDRGDRVVIYPEGVPGIGKGFSRRYRLQPFRTSFVSLAARRGCCIHPIYVVNGEWIVPFQWTLPAIDRLFQRLFGVPFLPLPGGLLAIAWPWVWWLAGPARLVFVVGDAIDARQLCREMGIADPDSAPRETFAPVAERIRVAMQAELDRCVRRYGRARYHMRSLIREARRRGLLLTGFLPIDWAVRWVRHDRDGRRPPARHALHALLRDWDLGLFYVPFGWPLLSLARALRRPPCGLRGLTRAEKRDVQGYYAWNLAERPLPARGVPVERPAALREDERANDHAAATVLETLRGGALSAVRPVAASPAGPAEADGAGPLR